jgi:hypothetical protein
MNCPLQLASAFDAASEDVADTMSAFGGKTDIAQTSENVRF